MNRVDEYGPTAMEKAEAANDPYERMISGPCTHTQHGAALMAMNRAMLAAMREHSEMMKKSLDTPGQRV